MLGLPVIFTPLLSKVCGKRKKRTAVGGCLFWGVGSAPKASVPALARPTQWVGCLGCIPTIFCGELIPPMPIENTLQLEQISNGLSAKRQKVNTSRKKARVLLWILPG